MGLLHANGPIRHLDLKLLTWPGATTSLASGAGSLDLGRNSMDAVRRSCSAVTGVPTSLDPSGSASWPARSPVLSRRDRLPASERALSVPLGDGGTAAGT